MFVFSGIWFLSIQKLFEFRIVTLLLRGSYLKIFNKKPVGIKTKAKIINIIIGLITLPRNKPILNHSMLGIVSILGSKIVIIINTIEKNRHKRKE